MEEFNHNYSAVMNKVRSGKINATEYVNKYQHVVTTGCKRILTHIILHNYINFKSFLALDQ